MNQIIKIFCLAFFLSSSLSAQTVLQPKLDSPQNVGIIYNQEFTVDFTLHTGGLFSLGVNMGKLKTYYKTTYLHFDIDELRHNKEHRQSLESISGNFPNLPGSNSRSFIFGKQNSLFVIRAGKGWKRYFSEKYHKRGVAVGVVWELGPSLGFSKPYYLELFKMVDGETVLSSEKYTQENADRFLDINSIFGSSTFSTGIGETELVPGIHAKAAMHFDWGAFNEFISALEVGVMVDVFMKRIDLMVTEENRAYFLNLYLNLQLGKRW
jgi:hypothetical protein